MSSTPFAMDPFTVDAINWFMEKEYTVEHGDRYKFDMNDQLYDEDVIYDIIEKYGMYSVLGKCKNI